MPIVSKIVRGNVVDFETTFTDADGVALEPVSATLTVNFLNAAGEREESEISMDSSSASDAWTASWDSSDAKAGRVYWSARSASPAAAEDGVFDLVANLANPGP
jgi:hypothetical protein